MQLNYFQRVAIIIPRKRDKIGTLLINIFFPSLSEHRRAAKEIQGLTYSALELGCTTEYTASQVTKLRNR
jgi:hypothetical protein